MIIHAFVVHFRLMFYLQKYKRYLEEVMNQGRKHIF